MILELLLILLLLTAVVLAIAFIVRSGRGLSEVDAWSRRQGLQLTPASRPWVETYLRTGRNLRQLGALGGLVVPPAVTAATGLDLHVSGLVWVLIGYLVGCLWSELALTRAPAGTRRAASLVTRRLSDYLPSRMRVAQVVLPLVAAALGVLATVAHTWHQEPPAGSPGAVSPDGLVTVSSHATNQLLYSGARAAAVLAPLIMLVVWLAQRYLIRRPQPVVDQSLVAADDALRSSSVHLLGASGMAAVCLLIASQCGYLLTLDAAALGALATLGILGGFVGAFLIFRSWRNAPWPVRHDDPAVDAPLDAAGVGAPAPDPTGPGTGQARTGSGAATRALPGRPSGWSAEPVRSAGADTLTAAPVDDAGSSPAWTVRRSPVPIAVAVIVACVLAGWGLRTWGGINPAITVAANGIGSDGLGRPSVWMQVHNEARVAAQITDLRIVPSSTSATDRGAAHDRVDVVERRRRQGRRCHPPDRAARPDHDPALHPAVRRCDHLPDGWDRLRGVRRRADDPVASGSGDPPLAADRPRRAGCVRRAAADRSAAGEPGGGRGRGAGRGHDRLRPGGG